MKRKNAVRLISVLLTLGVMMAIVLFSSQSGVASNQFSKGILQMILEALHLNFDGTQAEMANLETENASFYRFLSSLCGKR